MRSFGFMRKKKKAVTAVAGLILVCLSIVLLTWAVGRDAAEQPEEPIGEIPGDENLLKDLEDGTAESSADSQTEPSLEQGAEPASEPVTEPQEESIEEAESAEESVPVLTEEYELIYEGINVFNSSAAGTYFKYKDIYADLYMRRMQDDIGEYIELSQWSDQTEIWHTNRDHINSSYADLFWQEDSEHLTLDERLCYYVVPLDGTVYLMRYCVEISSNTVTMSYKVFGISTTIDSPYYFLGSEAPYDAGSISVYLVSDSAIDPAVSFPIEEMTAFADTVKSYMENGRLAASTLRGVFEFVDSADRDNPVSPYFYDIFPWISEMVTQHNINTESIHSPKQMLTAIQNALPIDTSVIMPDVAADGRYFITGDYYSDRDESYLTVHTKEDGSYGGTLLIDNLINIDFAGHYENGILTVARISDYPDDPPYELEMSFKNGKATVTITAAYEEGYAKVGDTFILDRNEKPEELEYLRNAYPMRE